MGKSNAQKAEEAQAAAEAQAEADAAEDQNAPESTATDIAQAEERAAADEANADAQAAADESPNEKALAAAEEAALPGDFGEELSAEAAANASSAEPKYDHTRTVEEAPEGQPNLIAFEPQVFRDYNASTYPGREEDLQKAHGRVDTLVDAVRRARANGTAMPDGAVGRIVDGREVTEAEAEAQA